MAAGSAAIASTVAFHNRQATAAGGREDTSSMATPSESQNSRLLDEVTRRVLALREVEADRQRLHRRRLGGATTTATVFIPASSRNGLSGERFNGLSGEAGHSSEPPSALLATEAGVVVSTASSVHLCADLVAIDWAAVWGAALCRATTTTTITATCGTTPTTLTPELSDAGEGLMEEGAVAAAVASAPVAVATTATGDSDGVPNTISLDLGDCPICLLPLRFLRTPTSPSPRSEEERAGVEILRLPRVLQHPPLPIPPQHQRQRQQAAVVTLLSCSHVMHDACAAALEAFAVTTTATATVGDNSYAGSTPRSALIVSLSAADANASRLPGRSTTRLARVCHGGTGTCPVCRAGYIRVLLKGEWGAER